MSQSVCPLSSFLGARPPQNSPPSPCLFPRHLSYPNHSLAKSHHDETSEHLPPVVGLGDSDFGGGGEEEGRSGEKWGRK